MAKKLNNRCPLQAECERTCQHVGHELDCDYYKNNAISEDRTIPDGEDITHWMPMPTVPGEV